MLVIYDKNSKFLNTIFSQSNDNTRAYMIRMNNGKVEAPYCVRNQSPADFYSSKQGAFLIAAEVIDYAASTRRIYIFNKESQQEVQEFFETRNKDSTWIFWYFVHEVNLPTFEVIANEQDPAIKQLRSQLASASIVQEGLSSPTSDLQPERGCRFQ